jgi:aspartate kinase
LPELHYEHLLEMTFWGAKVLHYRSVELAYRLSIPLGIALAHGKGRSTQVAAKEISMFESSQVLSINSFEEVEVLVFDTSSPQDALKRLGQQLETHKLPWPQLLSTQALGTQTWLHLTAPSDVLTALRSLKDLSFSTPLAAVSATCSGAVANGFVHELVDRLALSGITARSIFMSSLTVTFLIDRDKRAQAIACLHESVS